MARLKKRVTPFAILFFAVWHFWQFKFEMPILELWLRVFIIFRADAHFLFQLSCRFLLDWLRIGLNLSNKVVSTQIFNMFYDLPFDDFKRKHFIAKLNCSHLSCVMHKGAQFTLSAQLLAFDKLLAQI